MKLGVVLAPDAPVEEHLDVARKADALGLWAVAVTGRPGTEVVRAARIASATDTIRIVVHLDVTAEPLVTIAEELAVLDNLSAGRVIAVAARTASHRDVESLRDALVGRPSGGIIVSPPTVQTVLPVWEERTIPVSPDAVRPEAGRAAPGRAELSGDRSIDVGIIDRWRDAGCTHLAVVWPGDLRELARHLATRAATVDFPSVAADMADLIAPFSLEARNDSL